VPRRGRRTGGAAFDGGRHVSFFDKAKAVDVRRFGTDPFLHHGADARRIFRNSRGVIWVEQFSIRKARILVLTAATPVSIGQNFGWLHHANGDRGVVMCAAMGYEALCAHQSWRVLADGLAAAGLPTLRFDYPGGGIPSTTR